MPIVATAGHVDHGKSTLVQALTGRDPDRWREEKERGLTIDLGFAWADIGLGEPVGFVDVPGHERFIKNMLAGVGAVDVALFVVAADEGWMPQTEEHASVLDVLGVRHGVIALTRSDLVDEETLELAQLEVAEKVEDTTLEDWPVVPVAAPTGDGIEALTAALHQTLVTAGPPRDIGRPRLWIDRSFVIAGAGVVVTGTLVDGPISRGTELEMWPGNSLVRVRTIQRHEIAVESVQPGSRSALNLAGIDKATIERGSMLAAPGTFLATNRVLVDLRTVRSVDDSLTDRGAYQLHLGSGAWPVRLRLIEGGSPTGTAGALLRLDEAVPMTMGDRFVVRETGRRAVVAGGVVLDPRPGTARTHMVGALPALRASVDDEPSARATALLQLRGMESLATLSADSGGGVPTSGVLTETDAMSASRAVEVTGRILDMVVDFHHGNPLRPGIPKATIASTSKLPTALVGVLIDTSPDLIDDGATVRTVHFSGGDVDDASWAEAKALLADGGLAAPRASSLGLPQELLHALVRRGRLVSIADDLVYLPEQVDEIIERLAELPEAFTVSDFRDALGMSRRQAVPLLEWLDAQGVTRRSGDTRTVRQR